tara:strand:- start:5 stop:517 length:513 start_codon:yes stop_codon:yes gene_type:complete
MGQEFFINSQSLQSKVDQLLPSQGGLGSGFDLSASTQIVPIVDLTESAEGSSVRPDLQTALSHATVTAFSVSNTTTTIINNTGYFRIFGSAPCAKKNNDVSFAISDGATSKTLIQFASGDAVSNGSSNIYDFVVFLPAGGTVTATTDSGNLLLSGSTRQIADIDGNLTNP